MPNRLDWDKAKRASGDPARVTNVENEPPKRGEYPRKTMTADDRRELIEWSEQLRQKQIAKKKLKLASEAEADTRGRANSRLDDLWTPDKVR